MAEHFRDFLNPVIDSHAFEILSPEQNAAQRFYARHGGRIMQALGAERLPGLGGVGQKWRFNAGYDEAVMDIYEPDVVLPALMPRLERSGDVGLFYTYTGDENGPKWEPDTARTTVDPIINTGHPESDTLVTTAGVLYRRTRLARWLGYKAAGLVSGPRDRQARAAWVMDTERTSEEIWAHYDLRQDVYTGEHGMLDRSYVQYSSGHVPSSPFVVSLEEMQYDKIRNIGVRLGLENANTLVEVGSGWGGLAVELARRYPNLRITSMTVSEEQWKRAEQRAKDAGVEDRVEFLLKDYRDFDPVADAGIEHFDRAVSIEMIEAVDWRDLDVYLDSLSKLVHPEWGMVGIQAITIDPRQYPHQRHNKSFAKTAIFPGGVLTPREVINSQMEGRGFEVYSQDELTRGYAITLREWRRNLNHNRPALTSKWLSEGIEQAKTDRFYRGFNFYLAFSQAGFMDITDYHLRDWQLVYTRS